MSDHCLAIVLTIYLFYIYILMYRHVQETKMSLCFAHLYKKSPFCSLCILLHGAMDRWLERKSCGTVTDRSLGSVTQIWVS